MEEWDKVSWMCFYMPKFSKKRYKLEDFHPFRGATKQVNIFKLNEEIERLAKTLPKSLTNAEIDALWEKRKEKGRKDGSRSKRK